MWIRLICATITLSASLVRAGVVTVNSAEARVTFFGPLSSELPNTRTQNVELGDYDILNYEGAGPGPARGNGRVFYSFQPFNGGFQLFVQTTHQTFDAPNGAGGNASFNLNFTSGVPLQYIFESSVTSPPAFFAASTPSIQASAQFAGNNTWSGTIPHGTNADGSVEFGLFQRQGIIPAGVNTSLIVDSVTYESRFGNPPKSEGFLKFNVAPAGTAVPLPALALPAALCLAVGIAGRCWDRRRKIGT